MFQSLYKMDINSYIDDRNREIYEEVAQEYKISCAPNAKEFGIYTESKTAIFYIPENSTDKEGFTHELLHLYLKKKGYAIGHAFSI